MAGRPVLSAGEGFFVMKRKAYRSRCCMFGTYLSNFKGSAAFLLSFIVVFSTASFWSVTLWPVCNFSNSHRGKIHHICLMLSRIFKLVSKVFSIQSQIPHKPSYVVFLKICFHSRAVYVPRAAARFNITLWVYKMKLVLSVVKNKNISQHSCFTFPPSNIILPWVIPA